MRTMQPEPASRRSRHRHRTPLPQPPKSFTYVRASCGVKSANAVARVLLTHAVQQQDPHARQLTAAPYAGNLFAAYAENCAPVNGFTRGHCSSAGAYAQEEGGDGGGGCGDAGDGGVDDLLSLLGLLAPEVRVSARLG